MIAFMMHKIPAIVAKSILSFSLYSAGKQSATLFMLLFKHNLLMNSVLFSKHFSILWYEKYNWYGMDYISNSLASVIIIRSLLYESFDVRNIA